MSATLDMATGNRTHSMSARGDDLYETPPEAVRALLDVETISRRVWEPACGPGSIVRQMREAGHDVVATTLIDYGCEDSQSAIDFLMEWKAPDGCDTIITNPPFALANEFAVKAIELCPRVHLLMRVNYLEGLRWYSSAEKGGLGLGAHLSRVWVFAPRLPMMHRHGWTGKKASSAMPMCWMTFERHAATRGGAVVRWIDPRKYRRPEDIEATAPKERPDEPRLPFVDPEIAEPAMTEA